MSNHRGHGHCIAKGADIKRMMAELFGRVDGYCKGKGGSMHIADFSIGMLGANGIVAGGLPIAAGAALAAQLDGHGNVAVCFFGDGAVAEGEFGAPLQKLISQYAYGAVWGREALPRKMRSLLALAMTCALNRPNELRIHLRGALKNGCRHDEIREVLLQVAIYCGIPAALEAHNAATEIFAEVSGNPEKVDY